MPQQPGREAGAVGRRDHAPRGRREGLSLSRHGRSLRGQREQDLEEGGLGPGLGGAPACAVREPAAPLLAPTAIERIRARMPVQAPIGLVHPAHGVASSALAAALPRGRRLALDPRADLALLERAPPRDRCGRRWRRLLRHRRRSRLGRHRLGARGVAGLAGAELGQRSQGLGRLGGRVEQREPRGVRSSAGAGALAGRIASAAASMCARRSTSAAPVASREARGGRRAYRAACEGSLSSPRRRARRGPPRSARSRARNRGRGGGSRPPHRRGAR